MTTLARKAASSRFNEPAFPARTGGFTLIEVVVAIIIITIGALAAARIQLTSTRGNIASGDRQIAANLARQLLEAAVTKPYLDASLVATAGTTYVDPPAALSPTNPLNGRGEAAGARVYTRRWRVIQSSGASAPVPLDANYKTISVRVTWNQAGTNQTIEMETIKGW